MMQGPLICEEFRRLSRKTCEQNKTWFECSKWLSPPETEETKLEMAEEKHIRQI